MRRLEWLGTLALLACALAVAAPVGAKVLLAKDEALALAFPGAERIEERVVFLSEAQQAAVAQQAGGALESQLWTIYVGWQGGTVQGYAIIDNHIVRTLPEAFMVVLAPDGAVRRVEILAFYEPLEYMPSERWVAQFSGRRLDPELTLRRGIRGITGATLSATAMTAGVRRALALFEVVVRDAAGTDEGGATPAPAGTPESDRPDAGGPAASAGEG